MRIAPFELERWQSVWENHVELNIAESGVDPLSMGELWEEAGELDRLVHLPLGYPQTNGSEELRSRIAALYPGAKAENVLVTCGTAEANFLISWALIEPGDEIIFLQPNYMQILGVAKAFGATVKAWWLKEKLHWAPDITELERLVTPKSRLIAVCNPNNPTGAVLPQETMQAITAAAQKVGAWILADEVYRGAELDGETTPTFWGSYERVLCTAGLSKAYGLPGLRAGWIVAPANLAETLWGYKDYTSISVSMLTDRIATAALAPGRQKWLLERTRRILRAHYPLVRTWLNKHPDCFAHVPPRAGAIAWLRILKKWESLAAANELRAKKGVLLVPGDQFAMPGYLRLGFGGNPAQLERALARFDEWISETGCG